MVINPFQPSVAFHIETVICFAKHLFCKTISNIYDGFFKKIVKGGYKVTCLKLTIEPLKQGVKYVQS